MLFDSLFASTCREKHFSKKREWKYIREFNDGESKTLVSISKRYEKIFKRKNEAKTKRMFFVAYLFDFFANDASRHGY